MWETWTCMSSSSFEAPLFFPLEGVKAGIVESQDFHYSPVVMKLPLLQCQWRPHRELELPPHSAVMRSPQCTDVSGGWEGNLDFFSHLVIKRHCPYSSCQSSVRKIQLKFLKNNILSFIIFSKKLLIMPRRTRKSSNWMKIQSTQFNTKKTEILELPEKYFKAAR